MYEFVFPLGPPPSFDATPDLFVAAWLLMTVVGCIALLSAFRRERRQPPLATGKAASKTAPPDRGLDRAA
jgi:hypothetical protein